MSKARYIALLRGINVSATKTIKMAELRELLASLGFENVKTVLASGNAAWDADGDDTAAMQAAIEHGMKPLRLQRGRHRDAACTGRATAGQRSF